MVYWEKNGGVSGNKRRIIEDISWCTMRYGVAYVWYLDCFGLDGLLNRINRTCRPKTLFDCALRLLLGRLQSRDKRAEQPWGIQMMHENGSRDGSLFVLGLMAGSYRLWIC
jgi:hypothetical protein